MINYSVGIVVSSFVKRSFFKKVSIAFFTQVCIASNSGIEVSVYIMNRCNCFVGAISGYSRFLFNLQDSSKSLRMRCLSTECLNFFLGTLNPAFTGVSLSFVLDTMLYMNLSGKTENAFPEWKSVLICCSFLSRS